MKALRSLAVVVIAGLLVTGLLVDRADRPATELASPARAAAPEVTGRVGTWFCPGGSAPNGPAVVSIELDNFGAEEATAVITAVRSGSGAEPGIEEQPIPARGRVTFPLADRVVDSAWMGAVVEVDSADVVVEQAYVGPTGTDRVPCHTRTSTRWYMPSGATREASHGEEMVLLLLNPFPDDAVVDVSFEADVGVDSVDGVVVPSRRVVALDVTDEVTVAARVSVALEVRAGRIAVSRLQIFDGLERVGLAVTPAASASAAVWYLPTVHRADRDDVISVSNPSTEVDAAVDLEIIADGEVRLDPIELTVRPGRTVQVALSEETRLDGLSSFSIIARSLSGEPVVVMVESSRLIGDDVIPTVAASIGSDVASTRWLAPVEGEESVVVVVNPAATIATADLIVHRDDGPETLATIEIGARQRSVVRVAELGDDRPLLEVVAGAPVVVGRDLFGVSSHRMAPGIVAADPVRDADLG